VAEIKSELTDKIEIGLLYELRSRGQFAVPEVTIGWGGHRHERVDCLSMDCAERFRCYEIKISKSDFRSKAAKTFVGHLNYFVLPVELYRDVKAEIPAGIGVFLCAEKRYGDYKFWQETTPKRNELTPEHIRILKNSLIRSACRDAFQYILNCSEKYENRQPEPEEYPFNCEEQEGAGCNGQADEKGVDC